ncbi:MAG: hypothetical protein NDI77_16800, partial [Geobacteraceae bacterium]|nr:hypothetical protein [Geobacteraceae bacterium]
EKQEISVIGRLLSIEVFLLLMGIASLVSGIVTGEAIQLFWGVMIIGGSVILYLVKKKDWKKHWEEQERLRERYEQKVQERKEKDGAGKG